MFTYKSFSFLFWITICGSWIFVSQASNEIGNKGIGFFARTPESQLLDFVSKGVLVRKREKMFGVCLCATKNNFPFCAVLFKGTKISFHATVAWLRVEASLCNSQCWCGKSCTQHNFLHNFLTGGCCGEVLLCQGTAWSLSGRVLSFFFSFWSTSNATAEGCFWH